MMDQELVFILQFLAILIICLAWIIMGILNLIWTEKKVVRYVSLCTLPFQATALLKLSIMFFRWLPMFLME